MDTQKAYEIWSDIYDIEENKTRDLEGMAFRKVLKNISFKNCLEIGCGTGKNTSLLTANAERVTAVDFSPKMINIAKVKNDSGNITFIQADINNDWSFANEKFDLISFSLVLEHIKHLKDIFGKAAGALISGGYIYIGELHPFRQYTGTKAKFETENGLHIPDCYTHHISDFIKPAMSNNLELISLEEFFDYDNNAVPRILTLLLRKK